ncbi:MAG: diguanylate cyclase, partial [Deltaproteobacteria bacterium]|nr:diguanylate cyclase [Deltaproteobacteria bacterium]
MGLQAMDSHKTKAELTSELLKLRRRVSELEKGAESRIEAGEKIRHLECYDPCTGLLNRGRFIESLGEWISSTGSTKASGALLLLDIDQFKLVCDTYGHGMGDEFLRRVARMLQ